MSDIKKVFGMRWDAFFLPSGAGDSLETPPFLVNAPDEPTQGTLLERVVWNLVRGQWGRVATLFDTSRVTLPEEDLHSDVFITIRHIALRKAGKVEAERLFAQEAMPGLLARGRWDLALAFAVESAASAMNQGDYLASLARLDSLSDSLLAFTRVMPSRAQSAGVLAVAPHFWKWRASLVRGLCCQTLGYVEEAEKCLREQLSLVSKLPFTDFSLALRRRRMSLLVETERFGAARDLLLGVQSELEGVGTGLTRILWHVEALRLNLAHQDPLAARRELEQAETWVKKLGLPRRLLNLYQEKAEIELGLVAVQHPDAEASGAVRSIRTLLSEGEARVSLDSDCALRLLLAEALWLDGQEQDALLQLEIALAVAEHGHFGRLRVRILLALWSLRHTLGLQAEALELARRLGKDPLLLHLPLHARLAEGVSLCAGLSPRPLVSLAALLDKSVDANVMKAWLQRSRLALALDAAFRVTVQINTVAAPLTMQALLSLQTPLVLVCRRTRDVAFVGGAAPGLRLVGDTRSAVAVRTLFAAFLENSRGELSASKILRILVPGSRYRTARDAERVRAAVARLRKRLVKEGLVCTLVSMPTKAAYALRPAWGQTGFFEELRFGLSANEGQGLSPRPAARRGRPKADVTPRERDVALAAETLGSFRFSDIHAQFPVQRQTLQAYLQRLVEKGRLLHDKRGRGSRYVWRG